MTLALWLGLAISFVVGTYLTHRAHGVRTAVLMALAMIGAGLVAYGLTRSFDAPPKSDGVLIRYLAKQDEFEATEILRRWAAYRFPECKAAIQNIDTTVVEIEPAKEWQKSIVAGSWFERDSFDACGHRLDLTVVGWIDGHRRFRRRSAAPGSTRLVPQSQDRFLTAIGAARFDDEAKACQPVVIDVGQASPLKITEVAETWSEAWTFRTCHGDVSRLVRFTKPPGPTVRWDLESLEQEQTGSTTR